MLKLDDPFISVKEALPTELEVVLPTEMPYPEYVQPPVIEDFPPYLVTYEVMPAVDEIIKT